MCDSVNFDVVFASGGDKKGDESQARAVMSHGSIKVTES